MGEQIYIYDIAKRIIRLSGNILNNKKFIESDFNVSWLDKDKVI